MPLKLPVRGGQPFTRHALELWLRSPRGRRLLTLEAREVSRVLPEIFGRFTLQVGNWGREGELLGKAETLHRAVLGTIAGDEAAAVIEPERLPVAAKSVDAIVLPHTLEFSRSPHNVLREINRVLSDRGRLFVLGFNPWGSWALRARMGLRYRAFPQGARYYSVGRLCDWLELLDFEVTDVRRYSAGFPWTAPRSVSEAWDLGALIAPFAEAYLISARKRVLPMNFVGKLERAQIKSLVGMPVPGARREGREPGEV